MKFKQKIISSILSLALVGSNLLISNANTQQLEVHHINVGQGESIYIELPNGDDVLIDAGKSNQGSTVVNYLKNQENNIDLEYLIATHPDADHVGGMKDVFEDLNVKNFIYPKDAPHDTQTWQNVLSLASTEGCTIQDGTPGTTFNIGGATLKFIQSSTDFSDNNDDSIVTYLDYNNAEFLFTGDIEETAEKDMVSKGLVPNVDFMTVPHHGSKGSSTSEFLAAAKPEHAIVSVGNNSYGHPTADALNRYSAIGAKVYRTDQLGNIVVKTDGNTATINGNSIDASGTINDIVGHWAESQIKDFISQGYVNGYPDGTFNPNGSIKRAEFVKILNRVFGLTTKNGNVFNDTVNHWAKDEIDIAVTNGVCQGTSATTFEPNAPITREAAAKMIANYKKITDTHHDKISGYSDGSQTSSWAINEVEAILEAGYMNGNDKGLLNPTSNITRAEAVVVLGRVIANPNPVMPTPPTIVPPVTPPVVEPTPVPPVIEDTSQIVYANGGSSSSNKYHKSANAHGMKGAIKMTENEAKNKGYVACGSCFR